MAKKSGLYTRRGDEGMTSLADGQRVPKTNARLEAYGTLDELNSFIGLLMAETPDEGDRRQLLQVQEDLFALGSRLATADTSARPPQAVTDDMVKELERATDEADSTSGPWRGFVLPNGCKQACLAHVCRTVCRRLERRIYAVNDGKPLEPPLLAYVNRLSDYLFALARKANYSQGVEEKTWRRRTP